MGEVDLDTILNSVESNNASAEETTTETGNSEPVEVEESNAAEEETTSSEVKSEKQVGAEEKSPNAETETRKDESPKAYHRSGSSDLVRAQYSAQKWQKKYKRLKSDFDAQMAEFQKYRDLNAEAFENDEQRQQYLAWKASKQQRLEDLHNDMEDVANQYYDEQREQEEAVFNDKVERIYGRNSDKFYDLEDEWGDTFEAACNMYDKGNVVRDFVRNSPVGPAIKNVIYGDGSLQEDLFTRNSGNAMIDASDKLALLRNVEKFVMGYLRGGNKTSQSTGAKPVAKKSVPHLPPRGGVTTNTGKNQQPNVTGSLTRTESGGAPDITNEVNNLYHSIFG